MKKKITRSGEKSKLEEVAVYPYFGSFNLFKNLHDIILNHSQYQSGFIAEEISFKISVPYLRIRHESIFWNLIYLFTNDKIDYKFICPYQDDLPRSSDGDIYQLNLENPKIGAPKQNNSRFKTGEKLPTFSKVI